MAAEQARILVVDDSAINRMLLARTLGDQGHVVTTADDGRAALELLQRDAFDVVLLDIVMPEVDGYAVLGHIKSSDALRHLPVIVITAVEELDSVIRCIEGGATDSLAKPFNGAVLEARINASLAGKRLRDLELEYLEQVGHVTAAAGAVEEGRFDLDALEEPARRDDALGQLARVFQRMAREVRAREDRLQQQVSELRIEIDEARQATKVAEVTETAYFQELRAQAADLRRTMGS